MIIYGPYQGANHPMEVDTWPSNGDQLMRVINKYKSKEPDEKAKRSDNITSFFENRKRKIDNDIVKLRRANAKAKFSTWDNSINRASLDQLATTVVNIDAKLFFARSFIEILKENKPLMNEGEGWATEIIGGSTAQLGQNHHHRPSDHDMIYMQSRNVQQFDANNFLAFPNEPLDTCFLANHTNDQGPHTRCLDVNSLPNSTSMVKMVKDDYSLLMNGGGGGGEPVLIGGSTAQLGQNYHHHPSDKDMIYNMLSGNVQRFDANNFLPTPNEPLDIRLPSNYTYDQGLPQYNSMNASVYHDQRSTMEPLKQVVQHQNLPNGFYGRD